MGSNSFNINSVANVFNGEFYRQRYPDIRANPSVDAFAHYCQIGWIEGRDPTAWFSTRLYLLVHLEIAISRINPFMHYMMRGKQDNFTIFEALPPSPHEPFLSPETELIRDAFETDFYQQRNHDLGDADPFVHFCLHGWRESRDPTSWFSTAAYFEHNPDVAKAGANPFIHYIFTGRSEGREALPKRRPAADLVRVSGIQSNVDLPTIVESRAIDCVTNELLITGWAVAPAGIAPIEVLLDGVLIGTAHYGSRRPDIGARYPQLAHSTQSGFAMSLRDCTVGWHQAKLIIRDNDNNVRETQFSFEVTTATDAPAHERIRRKVKQAEIDVKALLYRNQGRPPSFVILLHLTSVSDRILKQARMTIASVHKQVYSAWNLYVVCFGKVQIAVNEALPDETVIDDVSITDNFATGTLIGLLRPGDELGADALQEMAVSAVLNPTADVLYSDERKLNAAFLKPDWSPDLLLATNYIGRLWFARAHLFFDVDLRHGEYDLLLHLTETARGIYHIPKVLCETHSHADTCEQEKRALVRAMQRRKIKGTVTDDCLPHHFRMRRALLTDALVSIIIPTIGACDLFKFLITSLRERTSYRHYEIIAIDGIADPEAKRWLHEHVDQVIKAPAKFNWSQGNNRAVKKSRGKFLVFINDDMQVTDPHWLHVLLEQVERPEVSVVGPLLLYPDGKVQHAGLVLVNGSGIHLFRGAGADDPGPFGLLKMQRDVIGVTGACLMVSRETFERVGGFDERHRIINNDLDFCLRCRALGGRIIFTPHTHLIHHEEASRAELADEFDAARFNATWQRQIALGDPYSHPHVVHDHAAWRPTSEPTEVLYVGHPLIGTVKRILVVKLDHIGDFITAIPAIDRLKTLFPTAEITALVASSCAGLARSIVAIDRVLEFNFFHARSGRGRLHLGKRAFLDLRDRLAPYDFDIAIDLRQQNETREVLRYTGATWLAGYDLQNMFSWLDVYVETTLNERMIERRIHAADGLLQLVEAVGIACRTGRAVLSRASQAQAREHLAPHVNEVCGDLFRAPLITMQPGGGSEIKQWPVEHFATVADLLIEGEGANILLIGSSDEGGIADMVMSQTRHKESMFSLVGKTTMDDLPDVLVSSDLVIGNNSGPHHLAAGLSVPTVGIHAGFIDGHEWGPLGPAAVTVGRSMHCSPCYLEKISDCHRGHACMRGLLPRDVYRVCQQMLGVFQ